MIKTLRSPIYYKSYLWFNAELSAILFWIFNYYIMWLYLHIFRGKPANCPYDWYFTTYHNSSDTIATVTGSVLHLIMIRSWAFGSYINNFISYWFIYWFHYGFLLAINIYLLTHYTRGANLVFLYTLLCS